MNCQDKNLLVITPHYLTFVKDQINELAKYFSKIYVFIPMVKFSDILKNLKPFKKHSKKYLIDDKDLPENIKILVPTYSHLPLLPFRKNQGRNQFKAVDDLIQKEKIEFDLIYCHFTWPSGYAGVKLKEEYGKRLVITAHGYDIYGLPFKDKYWKNKILYTLNNADQIVTVSKRNFDCVQKLKISTNTKIIPNGYDHNLFKLMDKGECREKINLPLDKKIILTVGNLADVKGHKYLIKAMKKVVDHRKDILCVIIGSGRLKNKLEDQIKELRLERFVKLVGGMIHDEIPIWMNACDIFVLPSLSESFGVVQIEAMACGKPVVATYNGGSEEIITSEDYGLLCESANSEELAEKILLALDKKWDKDEILNYAKKFLWKDIAKEIVRVCDEVMKDEIL